MKFCHFLPSNQDIYHLGVAVSIDTLLDLTSVFANDNNFKSLENFINATLPLSIVQEKINLAVEGKLDEFLYDIKESKLGISIHPAQIRCFSVYEKHLKNAFGQFVKNNFNPFAQILIKIFGIAKIPKGFYKLPIYYKGTRLNLSGQEDSINPPQGGSKLDYEVELGVIIGKAGKNIPKEKALEFIFGYVLFNDFSERDLLIQELRTKPSAGPAKGKDFDGSNAIGPWVVTADEIKNPNNLTANIKVNGETRGSGSTSEMTHSIASIIAYASWNETIYPGELLATGCVPQCSGVEVWNFLKSGDIVEAEIEKLGLLRNYIA
ncbi:fumarylacetoacetate hydrolase family protein [Leptospira sp. GIMC2001]|uniref:fumarylacetoacetate hydrolase family protein n=1 Tax=Leptospira sp. GIMC2001 TaxID=1513297 RepID=UPI00234A5B9F|nr:fumarylacetoacetate hydrolase family protein [Leptospira sp. GIMC2001]WCL49635.1 fumarylacetoacetate hydrolase family protein [Leptospira sp. GIMC2001]